jgi:hypothetical protein
MPRLCLDRFRFSWPYIFGALHPGPP